MIAPAGHLDGGTVGQPLRISADVAVVGSGPAGAVVAARLAAAGARVVILEAGPWLTDPPPLSAFGAMAERYVGMGAQVAWGRPPVPVVQGRMVGGSSPINGAICWRLPQDVHAAWLARDPALAEALPWGELERLTDEVEARLNVQSTDPAVAGAKNRLMARGADALGLAHRPIRRNVRGCVGSGRCLQGCPSGAKQSVDRTYVADALVAGAQLISRCAARRVLWAKGRAGGVAAQAEGGGAVTVDAPTVVVAASAIHTPALLLASGLRHGPVGRHLQGHPGVSVAGRFREPVRMWEGATQGHEVTGLRDQGLKFETLGFGPAILASRLDGYGDALAEQVADLDHWLDWGVAVRARGEGRVRSWRGRPVITWQAHPEDVRRYRQGVKVLAELMFAAGAQAVSPGVTGLPSPLTRDQVGLIDGAPLKASAYKAAITHLFGTCRMGSDPTASVVGPDFQHHRVAGLYVADSSVFPSNLGVNPQIPIMALAARCADRVLAA
ncbi:MAG: GMC family oxidoreductase [Myxococcales bacterium]|nr:GMC family oxidoreductase [Myxococcales bacterium]